MHSFRFIFTFLLALTVSQLLGQLNPEYQVVKVKKNELVTTSIKSIGNLPVVANSFGIDYEHMEITHISGNLYEMEFEPKFNKTGQVDIVIEYYDIGVFPGFPAVRYATYRHEIKESLVNTQDEVVITDAPNVVIDALLNDMNSDGDLTVGEIVFSQGGSASIGVDGKIYFTFDSDQASGMISYVAEDENGVGDHGIIRIFNSNADLDESVELSLNNKESISFYIANNNFELTSGPENGVYNTDDWISFEYTPNNNYVGADAIEFSDDNGQLCTFEINVVDKGLNSTFVNDDYVYTSINETIDSFNVFDNDFRDDFAIIDFSPELTYLGNGRFSYEPDYDEHGGNVFYYKIFSGLQFHEANIFISIDDFEPLGGGAHLFEVVSGNEFLIEHSSPVSGYTFAALTHPLHGDLTILSPGDLVESNCADDYTVSESSVVYLAEPGFEGEDAFELLYCTNGGNCHEVKIDITVVADNGDCICNADCVWPGDFNADGIVNMKDLASFGLNIGNNGEARDSSGSTMWNGFSAKNWNFLDQGFNNDLKHLDANGNGYVTIDDLAAFDDNYGKQSKLISKEVNTITETPLVLSTTQTEVDSGEWLYLDVSLGDELNPFIDFYSLAFQFNIDEDLIDEESACLQLADGSWIEYDSPLVDIFQQPNPGQMSFGITRLTAVPVSGSGPIATLKFIVEDELDGFRDNDGKFILNLQLENAIGYNHNGESIGLKTNKVEVVLNTLNEKVNELKVNAYPNPASDFITIESNKAIDQVIISDITGRLVESFRAPKTPSINHSVVDYTDGIYFIKTISGNESSVQKVSIISSN